MLPARLKPPKSGIARAPKREWPRHRKFVRSHECCVPNCGWRVPIEFAHVRTGTDGGTAQKPSDWWGVSLCTMHHAEQHQRGEPWFEKRHGISMKKLAREFALASPDKLMLEAMRAADGSWSMR